MWDLVNKSDAKLAGISGKVVQNLGVINLQVKFPMCTFQCNMEFFIVPGDKSLVLLGTDFCDQFKVDILFSKQIMRGPKLFAPIFWHDNLNEINTLNCYKETNWVKDIKPCIIKSAVFPKNLISEHSKKSTKNATHKNQPFPKQRKFIVLAQNNISIPRNSQSLLYFKLHRSIFEQLRNKDVLFEPQVLSKTGPVCLAKQLIHISSQKIPLLALNISNKDVVLKKHKMLGTFYPITESFNLQHYEPFENPINILSMKSTEGLSEDEMRAEINKFKSLEPWVEELKISDLTTKQEYILMSVIKQYHMVFSKNKYDIGRSNLMEINLNVKTEKPIFTRQYPLDRKKKLILEEEIEVMKRMDLIEETTSPFNAPLIVVGKSDGSHRVCTDFRKLNQHIPSEVQVLPTLEETLELLGDKQWFSNLDLMTAFQQLPLNKQSRPYTAFTCGIKRYQFKVLPFGLKNASSQFQGMMHLLLGSMQFRNAIIYIDDVLILSKTFEEHISSLVELFEKLKSSNLKLKPKKCNLLKHQVNFLGHVIMKDGIIPCENKVKAILNIPTPRNAKDIKSFLGLASYFRRFVPDFSSLSAPLNNLCKPKVRFKWTALENESFLKLKSLLINPPILVHPDMNREFIVTSDASTYGIGGILSQYDDDGNERAISYMSKKLNAAQTNYSATDLEILAVVTALEHFRPYLMGNKFKLVTDHRPILYLQNMKNPSARHFRYIMRLQEYDFSIEHRKGVLNGGADALSRNPQFLDSLHKLKNENVNYIKNISFKPEQIKDWKNELCQELNITINSVDKCVILCYKGFSPNSLYEQIAKILSNSDSQFQVIRNAVHFLVLKNRRYFEKSGLVENTNFMEYLRGIKSNQPANILELKTVSSILKTPIFLKEGDREEIVFSQCRALQILIHPSERQYY